MNIDNSLMLDNVKQTITFDLDFQGAGSKSFREHILWVLPKFFEEFDKIPAKALILSKDSKINNLFFNYCLFDSIHPDRLYYPQFLILELFNFIALNTLNFKDLAELQDNIMKRITYNYPIGIESTGVVKDNELWVVHKERENNLDVFTVIKFINF